MAPITLKDVHISGAQIGIQTEGPIDLVAENVTFDNVQQPWDIRGARSAQVSGTRITNDPKIQDKQRNLKTSIGWRRNGPPLPAFCPNCKAVFPSRNYDLGTPRFYSRDNEETCVNCGFEHARVSDGLFDLTAEAVRILSAPDFSHAMLTALAAVANDVTAEAIPTEAAIERFEAISPQIGELARRAWTFGKAAGAFITWAVGIAAIYYSQVQTQIATEALELQRAADASSDATTRKVLEALSDIKFVLQEKPNNPGSQSAQQPGTGPAESEPRAEARPVKLKPQRKPKARDLRRAAEREKRRIFGGSRHKPGTSSK